MQANVANVPALPHASGFGGTIHCGQRMAFGHRPDPGETRKAARRKPQHANASP